MRRSSDTGCLVSWHGSGSCGSLVIDHSTDQRKFGRGAGGRMIIPLDVASFGLRCVEKITVENGRLFAGKHFTVPGQ